MGNVRKNNLIQTIVNAAKVYNKHLAGKNIMFVFLDTLSKSSKFRFIETKFDTTNFLHFTGIDYNGSAQKFFQNALNNTLNENDININSKNKEFVDLKMQVLNNASCIDRTARNFGEFNFLKNDVKVEKVVGSTKLTIGFSNISKNNSHKKLRYYYPKTLLNEKIDENTYSVYKIGAIFSKNSNEKTYYNLTFLNIKENINFNDLFNCNEIGEKINYKKIHSDTPEFQKSINSFFKGIEEIKEENKLLHEEKINIDNLTNTNNKEVKTNENYTEFDKYMEETFENTLHIEDLGDLYYIYDKVKNKNNFEKVVNYLDDETRAKDIYNFNIRKIEEKQSGEEM